MFILDNIEIVSILFPHILFLGPWRTNVNRTNRRWIHNTLRNCKRRTCKSHIIWIFMIHSSNIRKTKICWTTKIVKHNIEGNCARFDGKKIIEISSNIAVELQKHVKKTMNLNHSCDHILQKDINIDTHTSHVMFDGSRTYRKVELSWGAEQKPLYRLLLNGLNSWVANIWNIQIDYYWTSK
jgi:hypothetical protein